VNVRLLLGHGLFVDDISITDYRSVPCENIDFPTFNGSVLNCYNDNNGTISLNTVALQKGASILRVHDVAETVQTVKVFSKLKQF